MERLTKHTEKGAAFVDCDGPCEKCQATCCPYAHQGLLDRLAAYEDTDLTPEEVIALKISSMGKEIAKITEFEGVSVDRLRELAQADKDGRVIVLPCKVGDIIDKVISHNEIVSLWYDKPNDNDSSYRLWHGMAWQIPEEYLKLPFVGMKGVVSDSIAGSDTIHIQVEYREEAENAL